MSFEYVHFIQNISKCVCMADSGIIEPINNDFGVLVNL